MKIEVYKEKVNTRDELVARILYIKMKWFLSVLFVCLFVCLYAIQIHISEPISTELCTHLLLRLQEFVGTHNIPRS